MNLKTKNFVKSQLKLISKVLQGLFKSSTINDLQKCDVLFLCHDVDRSTDVRGKAFSHLLDPVRITLERLQIKAFAIGYPHSILVGGKAFGAPVALNIHFLPLVLRRKAPKFFLRFLPNPKKNPWDIVLRSCAPTKILCIGAPIDLCVSAHLHQIEVIELLHGYRYNEVPWGYDQRKPEELPHKILALDPISQATFSKLRPEKNYCVTVTNPWYDFLDKSNEDEIPEMQSWSESLAILQRERNQGKKVVLVCLQWGYGHDEMFGGVFPNELFPEEITQVIQAVERNEIWVFRLHPVQLRDQVYRAQRQRLHDYVASHSNVFGEEFQMVPLPLMLSNVDFHISPGSGSTAEALMMGLPCLFVDNSAPIKKNLMSAYEVEITSKEVEFWSGVPAELADWLDHATIKPQNLKEVFPKVVEILSQEI
jgi:hypothetical protein